ncbi:hypothetical protein CK489_15400 [Bradyrhizobium sp. UFLA03-84]|uniref:hypothetical protein n=1 Tax=Bradyrhizobium sp. UFLA03-84 TaxID=418599 RepID=UPI000BAE0B47|nr:hypothetical protein [Bradyrhizobium sp. UFLA03-84]PAY07184.1 hypothetical protein CK489_15400 [Bradyrhizobium sp. UFLA03-84]
MLDDIGSAFGTEFATIGMGGNAEFADQNKGVTPVFFVLPVQDDAATEKAGALRMQEQEMVRIHVAGDTLNVATSPVTEDIKQRFPEQYKKWKETRQERHIVGTPLKAWPLIPAIRIFEFEALGIFSVENLAEVADANIHRLADGRAWREKAKAWLEAAKKGGAAAKYAAENERLREQVASLEKRLEELAAIVKASSKEAA